MNVRFNLYNSGKIESLETPLHSYTFQDETLIVSADNCGLIYPFVQQSFFIAPHGLNAEYNHSKLADSIWVLTLDENIITVDGSCLLTFRLPKNASVGLLKDQQAEIANQLVQFYDYILSCRLSISNLNTILDLIVVNGRLKFLALFKLHTYDTNVNIGRLIGRSIKHGQVGNGNGSSSSSTSSSSVSNSSRHIPIKVPKEKQPKILQNPVLLEKISSSLVPIPIVSREDFEQLDVYQFKLQQLHSFRQFTAKIIIMIEACINNRILPNETATNYLCSKACLIGGVLHESIHEIFCQTIGQVLREDLTTETASFGGISIDLKNSLINEIANYINIQCKRKEENESRDFW